MGVREEMIGMRSVERRDVRRTHWTVPGYRSGREDGVGFGETAELSVIER